MQTPTAPYPPHHSFALAQLRLLHTTDIHATLLGYDYSADRPSRTHSLARAASLIERLRRQQPNCLLLDGGDFLQGTPLSDWSAEAAQAGQANPVIAAFNAMGYDAAALGNHDFGYGLDFLKTAISQARFPILCANVFETLTPNAAEPRQPIGRVKTVLTRFLPLTQNGHHTTRKPLRIGLFGVLPPQVVAWERSHLGNAVSASLIADSAAKTARALRQDGADLIIALCHSGISETSNLTENASVSVAGIDDVDVVFSGHTHQVFPGNDHPPSALVDPVAGTLCGKPTVMAGRHGSHVGMIDLNLHWSQDGWHLHSHQSRAIPVELNDPPTPEAPALVSLLQSAHSKTLSYIRRPAGNLPIALNSFFSSIHHDHALRLVAQAQLLYVQWALRHSAWKDLAFLSAAAPLKSGGRSGADHFTHVAAGPISQAAIADLYAFNNDIAAVCATGAELRDWLEMSAGRYHQLHPGQPDQPLLNDDFASYNGDVLHGLTYQIDLSQPARFTPDGQLKQPTARRIQNLRHNGRPLRSDQRFVVACNSYRANGGGHFPSLSKTESLPLPIRDIRSLLIDHIRDHSDLFGPEIPAWRFTAMPGTSAIFDSHPLAKPMVQGLKGVELAPQPPAANGFLPLRLHL